MTEYVDMWKRAFDFYGTSDRRDYWMAVLVNFIINILISLVVVLTGSKVISWIYLIAIFIPGIALGIRRLRDGGHSPYLELLIFVPFAGPIVLIVLWAMK